MLIIFLKTVYLNALALKTIIHAYLDLLVRTGKILHVNSNRISCPERNNFVVMNYSLLQL